MKSVIQFKSMSKIKKIILLSSLILVLRLILAPAAQAHCPLCVGGAAVGLSVARYFGIDDSITGVWLAALLGAISFWSERPISDKITKKSLKKYLRPALYLAIFGLTIWTFYAFNDYAIERLKFYLLNLHAGTIAGLPKLVFGLISGGILFYGVDALDDALIRRNGKVYFPYQRVIVSLGAILILSLIMYLMVNYYL